MGRLSGHVRSNIVGYIALFFALGMGSAWAATELSKNEVKSKHIKAGAVKNADLADNAVTSPKVANGSLRGTDFAAGQLPQGVQGPKGDTGEPGPAGATNVVRRIGPVRSIGPDSPGGARVECDAGERAVGGGGIPWTGSGGDFDFQGSYPTIPGDDVDDVATPNGWVAPYFNRDANNDNLGSMDVRAYVICASP